jgi:hypothetical protein
MAALQTSFQKKTKSKVPYIPGSRPSIQNAQLLISSGVPSFDYVMGNDFIIAYLVLCLLCKKQPFGIIDRFFFRTCYVLGAPNHTTKLY